MGSFWRLSDSHVALYKFSIRLERADSLCSPLWCVLCIVYGVRGEAGYDGSDHTNHCSQMFRVSLVHHEIREARDGGIMAPLSQGRLCKSFADSGVSVMCTYGTFCLGTIRP